MADEYTPTTDEVRARYAGPHDDLHAGEAAEFDRWLDRRDRELRAEFAERVRELSRQGYSAQEAANKIERGT